MCGCICTVYKESEKNIVTLWILITKNLFLVE